MNSEEVLKKYIKTIPKPFNSILKNADKFDSFENSNIEKPQSLTPMEMELKIQADRVMFTLNRTIAILSVLAHLPDMLLADNAKMLRKNFTETEMNFIMHVLKSYDGSNNENDEERCDWKSKNFGSLFDTINRVKLGKSRCRTAEDIVIDGNLLQIINMIFNNKCIRQEIKYMTDEPNTIPYIVQFIREFQELKSVAKLKLYVTGTEEEARDKQLRRAFKSNLMLIAAIKDLEQQLENQRQQLGKELNRKVEIFQRYNSKIADAKEDFQMSIEKIIHDSEKKMMQQCLESEEKQATLSVVAEEITEKYKKLLEDHLDDEKKLRAKTMKTETQLQNWLTKYDQDMGEKNSEYEQLKAQYDIEKAAMDDLEEKMDEQESLYNTLMAEKEEEEERLFNEIAYKMLTNRAARIIQRAWRAYRERKSKRRGKKGKKGKDATQKATYTKKDDPNAILESKFKGDVFEEMGNPDAFN